MNIIKQRNSSDCGIACLAMFLKVDYDTVLEKINELIKRPDADVSGNFNNCELALIIKDFGFEPMQLFTLMGGVPAIVSVPSLATKKKFHYVYWDGTAIKDPSNGEIYTLKDFIEGFPLSDSITLKCFTHSISIPSNLHNYFDWNYVNKYYKK